jgi:hypothetical protein
MPWKIAAERAFLAPGRRRTQQSVLFLLLTAIRFKEYWFHYNLGKNPGFLSPKKNFGEDDPLNDFVVSYTRMGLTRS